MNADRREEKPTGGGRQRMKPAWKEQTGGLREEGKSKMAQIFRNEVRNMFISLLIGQTARRDVWPIRKLQYNTGAFFILKVQKEPRKIALGLEAE